ncbi:BREX-3 system phosphatase PglZ [Peribacillus asahii]|uniref:BREX-3 system phosphatase PglZ n=1 Tax=Peribacillus asahii TaxID=228899 RepID=A0A398BKJ4_9BACI|nr:BREX-3 system phosphatase PglZ [Peribacillus asahii]RID89028.1 BREX-3 system phosphatase PglZ [Peribacillus asahii]
MTNWRDKICRQFNNNNPLYLVLDRDQLLLDELILTSLHEEKIQVVNFSDSILFRYEFEREYRARIEQRDGCLLVRAEEQDYNVFPYDLLQSGQRVRLDLANIFPKFSAQIIRQLDIEVFDALYAAHERYQGSSSNKDTLDFLTKHLYKLPYDLVYTRAELWKLLLTIHYELDFIPDVVKEYIVSVLIQKSDLAELPIKELVFSSSFFYSYLGVEWDTFVHQVHDLAVTQSGVAIEDVGYYEAHPFTNPSIKGILDNLFGEGLVQPVESLQVNVLPEWMHVGIKTDTLRMDTDQLAHLYQRLKESTINDYRYKEWGKFAETYGQFKHRAIVTGTFTQEAAEISNQIDEPFEEWMLQYYGSLSTLPHLPWPKMVHHIPHYLATQQENKMALLVMDGMGFVQWAQIREELIRQGLSFEEHGVFAWVPTLTSVSRQSIFSGMKPFYFANSISTTNKESVLWNKFWENQGVPRKNVVYQRSLGQEIYEKENILPLKQPNVRVYGAVIDIVDRMLHGAVQGARSVSSELRIWLDTNYLSRLIRDLQEAGFTIYITADHGNRESVGIGRISEGVLAETKGERVRIYDLKQLRDFAAEKHNQTLKWNDIGLPNQYHVLLARNGAAFVNRGETIMSHGGISIEEVIVPFIKVMS